MTTPLLSAPAYEVGEYAEPVGRLPELLADPRQAAALTAPDAGFATYRYSESDVIELMSAAARRTLGAAGLRGAEVDTVLLVTDSLPRDWRAHGRVAELLAETGVMGATVLTLGLMDCATAMAAIGLAASLVRDGTARTVLVATGDLADVATGGQRIVAGGAAIASDAAATVLVSASVPGLPVLAMAHHAAPRAADVSPRAQLMARITAHRELWLRLAGRHAVRPQEVIQLLGSNFARNVIRLYLSDLGFEPGQLAQANVGRIAHCLGSDPLINLADLLADPDAQPPSPGSRYLLLGSGVSHIAAVLLDACPHPTT